MKDNEINSFSTENDDVNTEMYGQPEAPILTTKLLTMEEDQYDLDFRVNYEDAERRIIISQVSSTLFESPSIVQPSFNRSIILVLHQFRNSNLISA